MPMRLAEVRIVAPRTEQMERESERIQQSEHRSKARQQFTAYLEKQAGTKDNQAKVASAGEEERGKPRQGDKRTSSPEQRKTIGDSQNEDDALTDPKIGRHVDIKI